VRGAVRARRRTNRLAFVLGGIVLVFVLAFFSLAPDRQRVRDELRPRSAQPRARRAPGPQAELTTDLNRLGQEPAVRKMAIDAGLTQLAAPILVDPR
jgi:hypothetical protein